MTVTEPELQEAPRVLADHGGPTTTPSGATGLAGLTAALASPHLAKQFGLNQTSCVLLLITERALE
jgi:diaminopropionate ammonia-lyase